MPTIKEVLKDYESSNNIEMFVNHTKLMSMFEKLLNTEYAFISNLILKYRINPMLTPDTIQDFLEPLGLGTLEDVMEFVEKHKELNNILFPQYDIKLTEIVSVNDIINTLKNSWVELESNVKYDFGDPEYYLLDTNTYDLILRSCRIDKRSYVAESFDCEDFARTTKSWVTLNIRGNVTFANVEGNFYYDNKLKFAHGFNLVIFKDTNGEVKVECVEPQEDKRIKSLKDVEGWFLGVNRVKLRFIQF